MRVMAVDYGDARTGVAVSDISAKLIGETFVIEEKNAEAAARVISAGAVSRGVGVIVVGYPKNMNGTLGPRAEKSERFAELLRNQCANSSQQVHGTQSGIEVVLWDERMTTMSAHRILSETGTYGKKRKKTIDAVAASLILEGYLNSL
jgi:putative Holliday junction resolvase